MVLVPTTQVPTTRTLRSGVIVEVDERGRASFRGCSWIVQVPSHNPEPDFPSDLWNEVDCGARVYDDGHYSWHCANGHYHISYDDPRFASWDAEQAHLERLQGDREVF